MAQASWRQAGRAGAGGGEKEVAVAGSGALSWDGLSWSGAPSSFLPAACDARLEGEVAMVTEHPPAVAPLAQPEERRV